MYIGHRKILYFVVLNSIFSITYLIIIKCIKTLKINTLTRFRILKKYMKSILRKEYLAYSILLYSTVLFLTLVLTLKILVTILKIGMNTLTRILRKYIKKNCKKKFGYSIIWHFTVFFVFFSVSLKKCFY